MGHECLTLARLGIIFPKEEIALLGVACVKVLALVGALFLHEEEESGFAAVAYVREPKFELVNERATM